jgi:hypothetical protein
MNFKKNLRLCDFVQRRVEHVPLNYAVVVQWNIAATVVIVFLLLLLFFAGHGHGHSGGGWLLQRLGHRRLLFFLVGKITLELNLNF